MTELTKVRRIVIDEGLVSLTGDGCAAAILSQFLYWTERARDPAGWVFKSATELRSELFEIWSLRTIRDRLLLLVDDQLLERRNNPRNARDRTYQYRPDVDRIARALFERGFALDGYRLPNYQNDYLHPANLPHGTGKFAATIPEITPEITKTGQSAKSPITDSGSPELTSEKIDRLERELDYPSAEPSEVTDVLKYLEDNYEMVPPIGLNPHTWETKWVRPVESWLDAADGHLDWVVGWIDEAFGILSRSTVSYTIVSPSSLENTIKGIRRAENAKAEMGEKVDRGIEFDQIVADIEMLGLRRATMVAKDRLSGRSADWEWWRINIGTLGGIVSDFDVRQLRREYVSREVVDA